MDNKILTRPQLVDAIMYSTNQKLSPDIADELISCMEQQVLHNILTTIQYRLDLTLGNFKTIYDEAVELLSRKIELTQATNQLVMEYIDILSEKEKQQCKEQFNVTNNLSNPLNLILTKIQILNLQVNKNFVVGDFHVELQIESEFQTRTQTRPSYYLQFQLENNIPLYNINKYIYLKIESESEIKLQNNLIQIPIFTLTFPKNEFDNQIIIETFTQQSSNELLEAELQYQIKINNSNEVIKLLRMELENQKQNLSNIKEDLKTYQLQLDNLIYIDFNQAKQFLQGKRNNSSYGNVLKNESISSKPLNLGFRTESIKSSEKNHSSNLQFKMDSTDYNRTYNIPLYENNQYSSNVFKDVAVQDHRISNFKNEQRPSNFAINNQKSQSSLSGDYRISNFPVKYENRNSNFDQKFQKGVLQQENNRRSNLNQNNGEIHNQEIKNELTEQQHIDYRNQEQQSVSNRTYTIQVPEYYQEPIQQKTYEMPVSLPISPKQRVETQEEEDVNEKQNQMKLMNHLIISLLFSSLISFSMNNMADFSIFAYIMMYLLRVMRVDNNLLIWIVLSSIYDIVWAYFLVAPWLNNYIGCDKWIKYLSLGLFIPLQPYKLLLCYVLIKME